MEYKTDNLGWREYDNLFRNNFFVCSCFVGCSFPAFRGCKKSVKDVFMLKKGP